MNHAARSMNPEARGVYHEAEGMNRASYKPHSKVIQLKA